MPKNHVSGGAVSGSAIAKERCHKAVPIVGWYACNVTIVGGVGWEEK